MVSAKLSRQVAWFLLIFDIIGLFLSFNIVHLLRFYEVIPYLIGSWDFIWISFTVLIVLYVFDLYKIESEVLPYKTYFRLLIAMFSMAVIVIVSGYLTGDILGEADGVLGRFSLLASLVIFYFWAAFWRFDLSKRVPGVTSNDKEWLILGTGPSISQFQADFIETGNKSKLIFLSGNESEGAENMHPVPDPAGHIDQLASFAHHEYEVVVIGTEIELTPAIKSVLMNMRLDGIKIYSVTAFYEKFWHKVPVLHLQNTWFAMSDGFNLLHHPIEMRIKRILDILFSFVLLAVAFPVMMLTAVAIKLTSKGRIFFKQERVGVNGTIFLLYKFRTMYEGADKGSKYTAKNDSRITPVGNFLRLTRIDELPQLINVFKGEMSFIGPRAEWTRCVEDYEDVIPYYKLRHLVKPGITGWAQVNYSYGASVDDAREKLQYDLYYIKNYSIWLDLLIIFKTVGVVIFGKGR